MCALLVLLQQLDLGLGMFFHLVLIDFEDVDIVVELLF